jgi:hypothetical protein
VIASDSPDFRGFFVSSGGNGISPQKKRGGQHPVLTGG